MWRPDRGDFVAVAARVLGFSASSLERLPNLGLAESALAAPFAGLGGEDGYPTLELKAAVLMERLVRVELDGHMVLHVEAGEAEHEEIASWIEERTAPS